jgi:magnesium transporter
MAEIEVSSRLYVEDGAAFMTATVLSRSESDKPDVSAVTFILAAASLVTVRYTEPRPFQAFAQRAQRPRSGFVSAELVLFGLLEAIVDRSADILERIALDVELISQDVFRYEGGNPPKGHDFQEALKRIGRSGDLNSNTRESLGSIERLLGFLSNVAAARATGKECRARVKTLVRDVHSLIDRASFLSNKITFLLEATLGLIGIEQNSIIKIFSVAAVAFLPPTLIASIYGMNFAHMPELDWTVGYPFALLLMIVSAVIPFLYFKRRGWM